MNRFKFFKVFCFVLSIAAALYYPVKKIIAYEYSPSQKFEFKVSGFDPYDPARGHYLALTVHPQYSELRKVGQYAVLGTDKDGFATVVDVVDSPDDRPCVKLKYKPLTSLFYPFDRFYINEKLALVAEALFMQAVNNKQRCVLVVNVYKDGATSVSDLLIDGKSIKTLAAERCAKKK